MAEHAAAALKTMETHLGEMEKMKTQQDELQKQLQDLQAEKVNEADSAAHANGELADALQSQEALKLELQKSNERFSKSERLKVARVGEMQQRMESPEMQQSVERAAANHETESKKALQQALQDEKTRVSEMQARLDTLQAEKEMVEQSAQSRLDAMQSEKEKLEQRLQSIKEAEYTELLFILRALGNNELSDKLEHQSAQFNQLQIQCDVLQAANDTSQQQMKLKDDELTAAMERSSTLEQSFAEQAAKGEDEETLKGLNSQLLAVHERILSSPRRQRKELHLEADELEEEISKSTPPRDRATPPKEEARAESALEAEAQLENVRAQLKEQMGRFFQLQEALSQSQAQAAQHQTGLETKLFGLQQQLIQEKDDSDTLIQQLADELRNKQDEIRQLQVLFSSSGVD